MEPACLGLILDTLIGAFGRLKASIDFADGSNQYFLQGQLILVVTIIVHINLLL